MDKNNLTKRSRFLSFILRHRPEEIGLSLDENGWADVDELLKAINRDRRTMTLETLQEIVATDNKQRYAFSNDGTKIRASQGHSINIDLELTAIEPPDVLYHGTAYHLLPSIWEKGLEPQNRQYVHLSSDIETATKVGSRHGKPVVLTIDAKQMQADGHTFYLSENKVWLTHHVAPKYFLVDTR
jgi:RNA:NAD 2''-phosphotransferase